MSLLAELNRRLLAYEANALPTKLKRPNKGHDDISKAVHANDDITKKLSTAEFSLVIKTKVLVSL